MYSDFVSNGASWQKHVALFEQQKATVERG
jgi:hypothetical protein